ncbi:MCE family protein [Nocardioides sp.]|jgi:virulence factor Mce-like protein|uniref:MCE family protein n=1 Tax=Nocardioides sp. TaxID=35761 RepID=UPI002C46B61A|nr:MCE family protein [Nocardioides sp.]HVX54274.1 MCE family protein [Nocardioides sp.]
MTTLRRWIAPLVIAVLVLAAGLTVLLDQGGQKTLTAHFPRAVSIYQGSDVRVLGVPVGKVDKVTPDGTDVIVTMHYDKDVKIPADAQAVIVAPSIVGDRYVQLTPAYTKGKVLADGAVLQTDRTAVPLELDQIYGSLDQLVSALGPNGANKDGALSDLLEQTAANFGGQGAQVHQTIGDLSKLTKTLDDNKDALFGSAGQLETFVNTLAKNDSTVRDFTNSLSGVSQMLSSERTDLSSSLHNLQVALGNVATFVRDNKQALGSDIDGLNRVLQVVVKDRDALNETLTAAPVALSNLYLAYNPDAATLDTNANLGHLAEQLVTNPSQVLCTLTEQMPQGKSLCDLVDKILPRSGVFAAGTGSAYGAKSDPTLGGLVPATGGAR